MSKTSDSVRKDKLMLYVGHPGPGKSWKVLEFVNFYEKSWKSTETLHYLSDEFSFSSSL